MTRGQLIRRAAAYGVALQKVRTVQRALEDVSCSHVLAQGELDDVVRAVASFARRIEEAAERELGASES